MCRPAHCLGLAGVFTAFRQVPCSWGSRFAARKKGEYEGYRRKEANKWKVLAMPLITSHVAQNIVNILLNKITFVRTRSLSNAVTFFGESFSRTKHSKLTINTDVIGHVTIWFPIRPFLQVFYCNRICISSRFRDNRPQTFWSHDVDLSRSRDVIDQVSNRFDIGYFLLIVHCNQIFISKRFLIFASKYIWVTTLTF